MAAHRSPAELFPNLFGKKKNARQAPLELKPADMRLLQWSMREANRRGADRRPAKPAASRTFGKA